MTQDSFLFAKEQIDMISTSKNNSEMIIDHIPGIFCIISRDSVIYRGNILLADLLNKNFFNLSGEKFSDIFTNDNWVVFASQLDNLTDEAETRVDKVTFYLPIKYPVEEKEQLKRTYHFTAFVLNYPNAELQNLFIILGKNVGDILVAKKHVESINQNLEKLVKERTEIIEEMHREMVRAAHVAGMADVAANVLHMIGNGLMPIVGSTYKIKKLDFSSTAKLIGEVAFNLLQSEGKENEENKSLVKKEIERLGAIASILNEKCSILDKKIEKIDSALENINHILRLQAVYAHVDKFKEKIKIVNYIKKTMEQLKPEIEKLKFSCELLNSDENVFIIGQETKVIYVLNAVIKYLLQQLPQNTGNKFIKIYLRPKKDQVLVEIKCPLLEKNIQQINSDFFYNANDLTENGNALHMAYNFMIEMNAVFEIYNDMDKLETVVALIFTTVE